VIGSAWLWLVPLLAGSPAAGPVPTPAPVLSEAAARQSLGNVKPFFIRNTGQYPEDVDFYFKGRRGNVFLTGEGMVYDFIREVAPTEPGEETDALPGKDGTAPPSFERLVFRLRLRGADPAASAAGEKELPGKINYFIGPQTEWRTGIPTYEEVVYRRIWPGVDLRYVFREGSPRPRLEISPGADPAAAAFDFAGVKSVSVDADGALNLETAFGVFREPPLRAWQEEGKPVPAVRVADGESGYSIRAQEFDPALPLFIE